MRSVLLASRADQARGQRQRPPEPAGGQEAPRLASLLTWFCSFFLVKTATPREYPTRHKSEVLLSEGLFPSSEYARHRPSGVRKLPCLTSTSGPDTILSPPPGFFATSKREFGLHAIRSLNCHC